MPCTADNGWIPTRIYTLDDNLDVAGSEPLGSLDKPVLFESERWVRLCPTSREDADAPAIEMFVNIDGASTVVCEFCPKGTGTQLERFWDHVREKAVVEAMTDRWGDIRVAWGGPEGHSRILRTTLTVYFDEDGGWAYLTLIPYQPPTYRDLLRDYAYLCELFEASQR